MPEAISCGEKPGRKLGHVTILLNDTDPISRALEAERFRQRIRDIWPMS